MVAVLAATLVALFAASLALFIQGLLTRREAQRDILRQRVVQAAEASKSPIGFEEARAVLGLENAKANAFLLRLVDDRTLFVAVDERQGRLCLYGPSHRPSEPPSAVNRRRRG